MRAAAFSLVQQLLNFRYVVKFSIFTPIAPENPCPNPNGYSCHRHRPPKGKLWMTFSGQDKITDVQTSLIRRRSDENWLLLTIDLNSLYWFERRIIEYEDSKCWTNKKGTPIKRLRSTCTWKSYTCFVRWTFIIYRVVFVYSSRARTHAHTHMHTESQTL